MKFCTNCGSKINDSVDVCTSCGQPVSYGQQSQANREPGQESQSRASESRYSYAEQQKAGEYQHRAAEQPTGRTSRSDLHGRVQGRNILIAVVLSLVTCGIYSLVWLYNLEEETAVLAGDEPKGGMLILLSILTCGIYTLVWYYKVGSERMFELTGKNNGLLYLILSIFKLDLVNIILLQSDVNQLVGFQDF